jgi:predicted dehydrogenase
MANVRVGLIGTSWWSEAMYLPALADHPTGRITAIAGRDTAKARQVAAAWAVEEVYDNAEELIGSATVDAVIVASSNASHHPLSRAAIDRRLHVLCEKPLGLDAAEAADLADAAARAGIVSMTPFTYRWMPVNQQLRRHIDEGYVGTPYHMAARYYTGYGRRSDYVWRFDRGEAGSGVLGDLGSHWIDLAQVLLGPIEAISAATSVMVHRGPRPDGRPYEPGEDVAMMTARFASGASAQLLVSAVCWEGTPFGQTHHVEVHGSDGTLYAVNDWDTVQDVRGVRAGDRGPARSLPRPGDIWDGLRTDTVHNTYRDLFRTQEAMTRAWVSAIAAGTSVQPDLAVGAQVQRVVDAAQRSADGASEMIPV